MLYTRSRAQTVIESVDLRLLRTPLRVPYKLAFGPVTHFDTILVTLRTGAGVGIGEGTILTGYTTETVAGSWKATRTMAASMPGTDPDAATEAIAAELHDAPFAAAALTTAIEMAEAHPTLSCERQTPVPLLAGINATDADGIESEIEAAIAAGFDTLKIKVGFAVESDLARMRFIQRCNAGRARLRIDANQGYGREDACRFAATVSPESVELLEQPCLADDWDSAAAVAQVTAVPLMLDESIYDEADIDRAARIGAAFVKLKLMKFVSIGRLEKGLERIRALGMEPVLGNGVATSIGCWMEGCVARRHVRNAGEMNGFLRPAFDLLSSPLVVEKGAMLLQPGWTPQLDPAILKKLSVATARYG